ILYEYAKEIISLTSQSEEVIKQSIGKNESAIAIGASYTIGEYLLPQVLGDFQKSHRNIKFSLSIGNTPNIISELENNNVHIALVEGIVENKELHTEKISRDELILVVSHDHPWNQKQEIEIADIASEKMIWREENSGARKIIENTLSEYNILDKIKSRMELGSTQAIKSAVEANLGIAILPKLSVLKELELGVIKQIDISKIQLKRELFMVKKPLRFPHEILRHLITYIKSYTIVS
ncbi:MAG TPA: LysR substrate-binding domain-containing protein, partial [Virgibacillus sp.]